MKNKIILALIAVTSPLYCEEAAVEPAPQKIEAPVAINIEPPKIAAFEFVLNVDQKKGAIIEEIITTMGTSSTLGLGFKKNHLRSLGKQLDGLATLQFLGYIFSQPNLKKHMVSIHSSSLKWDGFMNGIKPGLAREASSKEFFEKLPGFAKIVNADVSTLSMHAEKQNWEAFVTHLVKN